MTNMPRSEAPTASIVLTVYNKAPYIRSALQSILDQSRGDFEIIIVDDASTDDSVAIISSLPDPRIHLIRQMNQGASVARNNGVLAARSDIVMFFDGDDWMHPEYVRTQLQVMAEHGERAFFASEFNRFSADQEAPPTWAGPAEASVRVVDDLPAAWLAGQTFITSCVAVRRQALLAEDPIFPPGESFGEDMDLWFRLAEKHALLLTTFPLIGYREDAQNNLTGAHKKTTLPPYLARLEARADKMPSHSRLRRSTLNLTANARITLARIFLMQGRRYDSLRALLTRAKDGMRRRRWWTTLFMTALLPGSTVSRWEEHRIGATQKRV